MPRPKIGSVPYGQAIYECTERGVVALTFDDGPWEYTNDLLDMLAVRHHAPSFLFHIIHYTLLINDALHSLGY